MAQTHPDAQVAHAQARARVTELGGGISNTVLLVRTHDTALVLKQSLAKLRVADDWEFDRRRLLVEAKCMEVLGRILEPGEVPSMLDLDRENLIFTMTAAPDDGVVWKQALLDGHIDLTAARRVGDLLGRIHRHAAEDPLLAEAFDDLMPLIEGRIEPYHRVAASVHPDLQTNIERDIARLTGHRRTLVLGDYSPKNLIVYPDRVLALDFEAAHWGDPSFDTGFLISHLVAKAIYIPEKQSELLAAARQFFTAYSDAAGSAGATPADTATEVGVLLLCRVDGKSKLEYLDSGGRDAVRRLARELIAGQVTDLDEALALAAAAQPDPSHR
jgi:5-methylthioribose kinase